MWQLSKISVGAAKVSLGVVVEEAEEMVVGVAEQVEDPVRAVKAVKVVSLEEDIDGPI